MAQMETSLLKHSFMSVRLEDSLLVTTKDSHQAMELLHEYRENIADFEYVHGNMDDVFLSLTNPSESGRISL